MLKAREQRQVGNLPCGNHQVIVVDPLQNFPLALQQNNLLGVEVDVGHFGKTNLHTFEQIAQRSDRILRVEGALRRLQVTVVGRRNN